MSAWRLDDEVGWQREAACRNTPAAPDADVVREHADRFFNDGPAPTAVRQACEKCPVRRRCLQFALDNDLKGYWGGMSEAQRRRLIKQRKAA